MIVDEDICKLISAKEGLPLDFVAKEFYMMELLRNLLQKDIMGHMIFKGGTAINNAYLKEEYRFSEDLDFDFVGTDWATAFKELVHKSADFESIESRKTLRGKVVQIDFLYKTAWGKRDRIRLDVNVTPNAKTSEPVRLAEVSPQFGGFGAVSVRTYGIDDLLARKLAALESRGEGKDIYDANNAFGLADKKKLLSAIKLLLNRSEKGEENRFIEKIMEKLKNTDYKKVRNLTNPYIPLRNRPTDWKIFIDTLIIKLEGLLEETV